jgi:hypothetical protein
MPWISPFQANRPLGQSCRWHEGCAHSAGMKDEARNVAVLLKSRMIQSALSLEGMVALKKLFFNPVESHSTPTASECSK